MSWDIAFIGRPENVVKALEENSAKLDGASKEEYNAALPHMVGLVKQNFNNNKDFDFLIRVVASGHGYIGTGGVEQYRNCTCNVEQLYGQIVEKSNN